MDEATLRAAWVKTLTETPIYEESGLSGLLKLSRDDAERAVAALHITPLLAERDEEAAWWDRMGFGDRHEAEAVIRGNRKRVEHYKDKLDAIRAANAKVAPMLLAHFEQLRMDTPEDEELRLKMLNTVKGWILLLDAPAVAQEAPERYVVIEPEDFTHPPAGRPQEADTGAET